MAFHSDMLRSYYGWSRFWGVSNWDPGETGDQDQSGFLGFRTRACWSQSRVMAPWLGAKIVKSLGWRHEWLCARQQIGIKVDWNLNLRYELRGEKKVGRVRSSGGMVGTTFIRVPRALVSYIFPSSPLCTLLCTSSRFRLRCSVFSHIFTLAMQCVVLILNRYDNPCTGDILGCENPYIPFNVSTVFGKTTEVPHSRFLWSAWLHCNALCRKTVLFEVYSGTLAVHWNTLQFAPQLKAVALPLWSDINESRESLRRWCSWWSQLWWQT